MDVSGIGSNSLMQSVWADLNTLALDATEDSDSTTASNALLRAATLELSGPGKLFAGLEQAYQQDPDKFAATLNAIADKLEGAAEETEDSKEKQMLSDMASRFRDVAESGDISQLRPPGGPGGPHGPGGPQSAYTSASEQSQKTLLDYLTESDDANDSATLDLQSLLDRLDSLLAEYLNKSSSPSSE